MSSMLVELQITALFMGVRNLSVPGLGCKNLFHLQLPWHGGSALECDLGQMLLLDPSPRFLIEPSISSLVNIHIINLSLCRP
jgi:hypothetical protein